MSALLFIPHEAYRDLLLAPGRCGERAPTASRDPSRNTAWYEGPPSYTFVDGGLPPPRVDVALVLVWKGSPLYSAQMRLQRALALHEGLDPRGGVRWSILDEGDEDEGWQIVDADHWKAFYRRQILSPAIQNKFTGVMAEEVVPALTHPPTESVVDRALWALATCAEFRGLGQGALWEVTSCT